MTKWLTTDDVTEWRIEFKGEISLEQLRDMLIYKCNLKLAKLVRKMG